MFLTLSLAWGILGGTSSVAADASFPDAAGVRAVARPPGVGAGEGWKRVRTECLVEPEGAVCAAWQVYATTWRHAAHRVAVASLGVAGASVDGELVEMVTATSWGDPYLDWLRASYAEGAALDPEAWSDGTRRACRSGSALACTEWGVSGLADADAVRSVERGCQRGDPAGCAALGGEHLAQACAMGFVDACVDPSPLLLTAQERWCSVGHLASCLPVAEAWVNEGRLDEAVPVARRACAGGLVDACQLAVAVEDRRAEEALSIAVLAARTEASAEWKALEPRIDAWETQVERDVEAWVRRWERASVTVAGRDRAVAPEELEGARALLAQYAGRHRGQLGYDVAWVPAEAQTLRYRNADGRRTRVQSSRTSGMWLGVREVDQDLWERVAGTRPAERPDCAEGGVGARLPVHCVSWLEVVAFANRMSRMEGLEPVYDVVDGAVIWRREADGYRLPTEEEWAAAAATGGPWTGAKKERDLCQVGNVADRSAQRAWPMWPAVPCDDGFAGAAPVGSFAATETGLRDLVGNVREWVWDAYVDRPGREIPDSARSAERVVRGGSWCQLAAQQRADARTAALANHRDPFLGFRLVRGGLVEPARAPRPSDVLDRLRP